VVRGAPSNTYEATGVKRVNSFSPVLDRNTGVESCSCFTSVSATHTYEATGVKRVNSFSPVLDRNTGVESCSCFTSVSATHSMRAVRRSLSITCEPGDGSDTYARSAAPHDLAIRAGRVNQAQ